MFRLKRTLHQIGAEARIVHVFDVSLHILDDQLERIRVVVQ